MGCRFRHQTTSFAATSMVQEKRKRTNERHKFQHFVRNPKAEADRNITHLFWSLFWLVGHSSAIILLIYRVTCSTKASTTSLDSSLLSDCVTAPVCRHSLGPSPNHLRPPLLANKPALITYLRQTLKRSLAVQSLSQSQKTTQPAHQKGNQPCWTTSLGGLLASA